MRRIRRLAYVLLGAIPLFAATGSVRVLDDFETASSIGRWEGPIVLAHGPAAHGISSARVAFAAGHSRISSRQLGSDWSGYDLLAFDIRSDSEEPKAISLTLYDEVGGDEGKAAKYDYFDANRKLLLLQGWNHFRVELRPLLASNTMRDMDLRRVARLSFSAGQEVLPLTIHVDNLRLITGPESSATASRTMPADALTTVSGRWFSVRQVADPDDLPGSSQVIEWRKRAEGEAESLRNTIRVAHMQGLDTIYSERRLVVADLGLQVRPTTRVVQQRQAEVADVPVCRCRLPSGTPGAATTSEFDVAAGGGGRYASDQAACPGDAAVARRPFDRLVLSRC
ncbi:MAG: hypothetical protein QM757_25890 [Paludibaculum sp.]